MRRSLRHHLAATALAGASLLIAAAPVAAVPPTTDPVVTIHREGPFEDCPGFGTIGSWDVTHKLTTFYNADGVAIRDIERIDFTGRIINAETGAWVPDSGSKTFFDTLAPDGSYLTTYM